MMRRSTATIIIIALFMLIIACLAILVLRTPPPAPPMAAPSVVPAAPVATAPPSTLPSTPSDQIIDLFQPSAEALNQQLSATDISRQIENAMVVSYTLMHCNLMTQTEYSETFNALITHAIRNHLEPDTARAEARVRSIASAAAGSYSMVYSSTPCDDPSLPDKATALKNWRTAVLKPAAPAP
jgi:hypothetical protein